MHTARRNSRRLLLALVAGGLIAVVTLAIFALRPAAPTPPPVQQNQGPAAGAGVTGQPASATAGMSPEDLQLAEQVTAEIEPLLASKQFDQVQRLARAAIDRFPQYQRAYLLAAQAEIGLKESAKAYEHLKSALAIGPENAEIQTMAGTMASQVRLDQQAIEHFTRATILAPDNPTPFMLLGAMYMRAPNASAESPANDANPESSSEIKALINFRKASMLAPDLATPYAAMAEISLRQNNITGALTHIQKARTLEPSRLAWRLLEARVHKRDNQPQKAIDLLINLPPAERLTDPALPLLADSYAMLRRFEQAAMLYDEAARQTPDLAQSHTQKAQELRARINPAPATNPNP